MLLTTEEPRAARLDGPIPGTAVAERLGRRNLLVALARGVQAGTVSDADIIVNHAAERAPIFSWSAPTTIRGMREILLGGVTRALVTTGIACDPGPRESAREQQPNVLPLKFVAFRDERKG